MRKLDGFNPWANAFMKRSLKKAGKEFECIQQQANMIPPVADVFTDLDLDWVLVTVTEDDAPNPAPRVEPTPTPTEMVEMALESMDYDKVDLKTY
jgi:hypothetical protein